MDMKQRPTPPVGMELMWPSESNRVYTIERTTNMIDYITVQSAIPATPGTNTYLDTTATGSRTVYKISVQIAEE